MKKVSCVVILVLSLLITNGCENTKPKITEERAKSIVIEHHTSNNGKVDIISVTHKKNEYMIVWDKKENCENGIDYIDDQNGEIKEGQTTIC
ncbi:hypothetical protein [Robertmurraya korlensis]|uniref:hypothetical protein n=1 Tax=Robertmurraya korlensis TaxID=519977 RepID=UPI0008270BC8|nr:hypothetical protein [Robertmurraya korlensis]